MEQPAPRELKRVIKEVFKDSPYFTKREPEIFNPGHGPHDDGSAVDLFINALDNDERQMGDEVANLIFLNKAIIHWGAIIWNRKTWDNGGANRPYEQAKTMPHTDHIHVEWGPKGRVTASFPDFEDKLRDLLKAHLAAKSAAAP